MRIARGAALVGMLVAALSAATPALARDHVFEACDGRGTPGDRDGGMAQPVSNGVLPPGASGRFGDLVRDGADQADACTRALADARLTPEMGLRRAHLLRARALARLAGGDADEALADVDAANAAAGPLASDPLYLRSMGLSLTLVRGAALDMKGDHMQAGALAASAASGRPYSVAVQAAATLIARHAREAAGGDATDLFAGLLPLDPETRQAQFAAAIEAGRFARALKLYARLAADRTPAGTAATADVPALLGPVGNGLNASYAYAATGEPGRARALLAETRGRIDRALAPPEGSPETATARSRVIEALRGPLTAAADQWGTLIGARASIAEGHPVDALKALVGASLPVSAVGVDLLTALRAALPPAQVALAPDPALLAAKLDERRRAEKLNVALLRRAMPAPETGHSLAGYGKASSGFLSGLLPVVFSPDGFTSRADPATGVTTVEFTGQATSAPVVDELTLLRAADLARAAGKPALIVVSRRDYSRTMNTYSGYGHTLVASRPAGYKTVLGVRFVDPAALPADLADEHDRVLDADRIRAGLAPVYLKR